MRKHRSWLLLVAGACLWLLPTACGDDDGDDDVRVDAGVDAGPDAGDDAGPTTTALVRAVHLSPGAPNVDVFVNDATEAVVTGLGFTEGTDYLEVEAGSYDFDVAPTGGAPDDTVLAVDDVQLEAGMAHTVVAYDVLEDIQALLLVDDLSSIADDVIRVRPVHVAVGFAPVDVWDVTDPGAPVPLVEDIDFGQAADALEVPTQEGGRVIGIDADNDALMEVTFDVPDVGGGILANLYAASDGTDPFLLAQLPMGEPVRIDPAGPAGFLRVLHASPDAPAVDIFIDDATQPSLTGVEFGQSSGYTRLAAGTYDISVVPSGGGLADAVVAADDVEIEDGAFVTAAAYNLASDLELLTFVDDYGGLAPTGARVRAIHVAPAFGPVDVLSIPVSGDPMVIYDDLELGTAGPQLDLPAGDYTIGIDADNDLTPELTFSLVAPEGVFADVYAVNDTSTPPMVQLLVQLRDGTVLPVLPN